MKIVPSPIPLSPLERKKSNKAFPMKGREKISPPLEKVVRGI